MGQTHSGRRYDHWVSLHKSQEESLKEQERMVLILESLHVSSYFMFTCVTWKRERAKGKDGFSWEENRANCDLLCLYWWLNGSVSASKIKARSLCVCDSFILRNRETWEPTAKYLTHEHIKESEEERERTLSVIWIQLGRFTSSDIRIQGKCQSKRKRLAKIYFFTFTNLTFANSFFIRPWEGIACWWHW